MIPLFELEANPTLKTQNNPDPTATVTGPSPVGRYADPK